MQLSYIFRQYSGISSATNQWWYPISITAERSWQFSSLLTFYHGLHSRRGEVPCCNSTQHRRFQEWPSRAYRRVCYFVLFWPCQNGLKTQDPNLYREDNLDDHFQLSTGEDPAAIY